MRARLKAWGVWQIAAILAVGISVNLAARARVVVAAETASGTAADAASSMASPFVVEGKLRKNLEFWIRIYTEYYTYQGLIHDAKYVDLIYDVMDFRADPAHSSRAIKNAKKKWRALLLAVNHKQKNPEKLTVEERRVYDLFKGIDEPNKFLNAANRKRLRFQLGQRDRFIEGLKMSGRYLPAMEEVFRRQGLPVQLTRLPFVESSFNVHARSKVGASGIWQFMRSTGKLFLKINDSIDERNDPIRATEAAARLLKQNYDSLKSWPLAITAYNHGRQGMMRAVRRIGSVDLDDVVSEYRSRSFGFASGNFYTELAAAIEVERNSEKYFGKIERDRPLQYMEVQLPDYINARELTRFMKIDSSQLKSLNPGLTELALEGKRLIPAGYKLRLPNEEGIEKDRAVRIFLAGYDEIPALYKQKGQRTGSYGRSRPKR